MKLELSGELLEQAQQTLLKRKTTFSYELVAPPASAIAALEQTANTPKIYLRDRDTATEYLGLGVCLERKVLEPATLEEDLAWGEQLSSEAAIFVGVGFAGARELNRPSELLPRAWIICPQYLLRRNGASVSLILTVPTMGADDAHELVARLLALISKLSEEEPRAVCEFPELLRTQHLPDRAGFIERASVVAKELESGELEKTVLARSVRGTFAAPVDPLTLLKQVGTRAGKTYQLAWIADAETAFVSVSPERLFRLTGDLIESEALGGTLRVGTEELPIDQTILREHESVRADVERRLDPVARSVKVAATEVLRYPTHAHLRSPITAQIRQGSSWRTLLLALAPTSAVCGVPEDSARKLIDQLEDLPRGWYAGSIGIVDRDQAEFIVGLRSLMIHGAEVVAHAGSGLVRGSVPVDEWIETERKLSVTLGGFFRANQERDERIFSVADQRG